MKLSLFSFLIFFLHINYGAFSSGMNADNGSNQSQLFTEFANRSWHSSGTEEVLIREFNRNEWGPNLGFSGGEKTIFPPIMALKSTADAYNAITGGLKLGYSLYTPKAHAYSKFTDELKKTPKDAWRINTYDSPETWMGKLQLREIVRLKDLVKRYPLLINDANFRTDDLVRARAISGVFWVSEDGNDPEPRFSGMLIPGQSFGEPEFRVLTCLHGFHGSPSNGTTYYFVPYGVSVDLFSEQENVFNKGFAVTHVEHYQRGQKQYLEIDENPPTVQPAAFYAGNDFAVATISNTTNNDTSLKDILVGTALGMIQRTDMHLPLLEGERDVSTFHSSGLNLEDNMRLFTVGLAAYPAISLSNDMIVSTTLRNNDSIIDAPRRSAEDDSNIKEPPQMIEKVEERASSLALYGGMSGGPVLRCWLDPRSMGHKKCKVIGTNWGDSRIYHRKGHIIGLRSVINSLLH